MAKPVLLINGHDYAAYVEELNLSYNDLDAEGSGRDVTTGRMYRTRVATKLHGDVKLLRMSQSQMQQLASDISPLFYTVNVIDPTTGSQVSKTVYTSKIPFGAQRYDKEASAPYYDGVTFSFAER